MNTQRTLFYCLVLGAAAVVPACKSKKLVVQQPVEKSSPVAPATPAPAPVAATPVPKPVTQEVIAPVTPAKPDLNFSNIQFDFNSAVLRTDNYEYLDHIAIQMKQSPNSHFEVNGFASAEGTPTHNLTLSADRANAVKAYLSNAGIDISRLSTKGLGEEKPVAPNDTETGRQKNRRVEVKIING